LTKGCILDNLSFYERRIWKDTSYSEDNRTRSATALRMKEAVEELVADFERRRLPEVTPRHLRMPRLPGKIDVIVGMRRSGKTSYLFQELRSHEASGVGRDRLLYLDFEDERLAGLTAAELRHIPDVFYRRHPASREQTCWFYFDEIQNVPGWERFLRRLIDTEQVVVTISGSSAKLLSREIATSLRGRSLTSELFPFSFAEALAHAGLAVPVRWPPPSGERSQLEHRLDRYLEVGGFPEVQDLPVDLRRRVLRDYVDVVLFRDVAERHGVANLEALRHLQRSLLARPANCFSIHRLHNDLRSQGVRVGKDSLHQYLAYLEDAFLVFTVEIAAPSIRARQVNPRKCYLIDPGLTAVTSLRASADRGHRLENLVYLELRRRGCSLAYLHTAAGHEVDFLAELPDGSRELVQVTESLADARTRERELRALREAMDELEVADARVVTRGETETIDLDGRRVAVVPAWRWLLEPPAPPR